MSNQLPTDTQRILMVIAPDQFRDEELNMPRQLYEQAGYGVDIASPRTGTATGMLGAQVPVEMNLNDVVVDNYQAITVVGGMGSPEYLWENQTLATLVREFDSQRKVVSAICLSGVVLAKAGVLKGKQATVWETPESVSALKEAGATYTGEPVTVDGLLVTGNGPEAAADFGRAVLEVVSRELAPTA